MKRPHLRVYVVDFTYGEDYQHGHFGWYGPMRRRHALAEVEKRHGPGARILGVERSS